MPTYTFRCRKCGHRFSDLVPYSRKAEVRCPECGGEVTDTFAGIGVVTRSGQGGGERPEIPQLPAGGGFG